MTFAAFGAVPLRTSGITDTGGITTVNSAINAIINAGVALLIGTGADNHTGLTVFATNPTQTSPVLAVENSAFTNVLTVDKAGNVDITQAGAGLKVGEGANAKQGTAVLVAGTVTVANTSVTATSRIFLMTQAPGGTAGFLVVSARVAGTSFTILSSNAADTSTVAYEIFEPG